MDNTMVKVEDLCIAVDEQLENLQANPNAIILAIYNYIQNITIIYPNTYVQILGNYLDFIKRLEKSLNEIEILPDERSYILSYFRTNLFDIDMSVIR